MWPRDGSNCLLLQVARVTQQKSYRISITWSQPSSWLFKSLCKKDCILHLHNVAKDLLNCSKRIYIHFSRCFKSELTFALKDWFDEIFFDPNNPFVTLHSPGTYFTLGLECRIGKVSSGKSVIVFWKCLNFFLHFPLWLEERKPDRKFVGRKAEERDGARFLTNYCNLFINQCSVIPENWINSMNHSKLIMISVLCLVNNHDLWNYLSVLSLVFFKFNSLQRTKSKKQKQVGNIKRKCKIIYKIK